MNTFAGFRRSTLAVALLLFGIFLLSQCIYSGSGEKEAITNASGKTFAGAAACINCHKEVSADRQHTAHFLTSRPGTAEYIKGSFDPGHHTFSFNDSVTVAMEKRNGHFYQTEYHNGTAKRMRRFDMVIGSGTMGQSYLTWRDDHLFQLPITYFTAAKEWSNSPGFPERPVFNRVITSRCLECHTTFVATLSDPGKEPEAFNAQKIIYGIDCEKCHGPGLQHALFQQQHPLSKIAKYIVNPARLTRQQNLDLCALCHGGRLQKTKPSFTFSPGDTLSHYFSIDTAAPDPNKVDVHGNQYALLRASKCFRQSATLTCNTCHDTHKNEKGQVALFSQRCMNCHNTAHNNFSKESPLSGASVKANCIDCHMPLQSSRAIAVFLPGDTLATAAKIRSHYIAVYPGESKRLLEEMKKLH